MTIQERAENNFERAKRLGLTLTYYPFVADGMEYGIFEEGVEELRENALHLCGDPLAFLIGYELGASSAAEEIAGEYEAKAEKGRATGTSLAKYFYKEKHLNIASEIRSFASKKGWGK